jgi:hypothetical protein
MSNNVTNDDVLELPFHISCHDWDELPQDIQEHLWDGLRWSPDFGQEAKLGST